MAQKIQVMLLCDLDDGNVEAAETLHFSLGKAGYEVDVCGKHAQQIRDSLEPFAAHARTHGYFETGEADTGAGFIESWLPGYDRRAEAGRDQTAGIRTWAKERGIQVNDRGRIPVSVLKEYEAAH